MKMIHNKTASLIRVLIIAALVLLTCFIGGMALQTYAADDEYEYTIRVYSGGEGTFDDGTTEKVITAKYGETVNLGELNVVPSEDHYLFSGFRLSGRDNRWAEMPAFTVEKDVDYVAAYAIRGPVVNYTLVFVEYGTGKTLLSSITMEGNVGDKPIESYRYIEGYMPLYRNITKTLSEDEAENVFTFEYYVRETGSGAAGAGGNGSGSSSGSGDLSTKELYDADTHLSGSGAELLPQIRQASSEKKSSPAGWIIGGAAAVVVILVIIVLMSRRRRRSI